MDVYHYERIRAEAGAWGEFEQKRWTGAESLWEALELDAVLGRKAPFVAGVSGGGGETFYGRRLAWEGRQQGLRVLVIPTTHMAVPERFAVLEDSLRALDDMIKNNKIAVTGKLEEKTPGRKKISFWGWEFYHQAIELADLILTEADGARCLPLKAPGPDEPVIPPDTNLILSICGLKALGKKGEEVCFRREPSREILNRFGRPSLKSEMPWIVETEDMACLMKYGYVTPLKNAFPNARVVPVCSQADSEKIRRAGENIIEQTGAAEGLVTGNLQEESSFTLF